MQNNIVFLLLTLFLTSCSLYAGDTPSVLIKGSQIACQAECQEHVRLLTKEVKELKKVVADNKRQLATIRQKQYKSTLMYFISRLIEAIVIVASLIVIVLFIWHFVSPKTFPLLLKEDGNDGIPPFEHELRARDSFKSVRPHGKSHKD